MSGEQAPAGPRPNTESARPEPFHHNAAISLEFEAGFERALVIALSTISTQLDYLIDQLVVDGPRDAR